MTPPLRVGFCVSGGGTLVRAAIARADALGIVPAVVVLVPGASDALRNVGVPVAEVDPADRERFDDDITRALLDADLDLLCLSFDWLIPRAVVERYAPNVLNVHMSLLPAFAGLHGLRRTVTAGVRFGGATIHELGAGTDDGPIVAQCVAALHRGETEAEFGGRLYPQLQAIYLQTIAWYAAGRVERDADGRVWIRDAVYGELPVSPALEQEF